VSADAGATQREVVFRDAIPYKRVVNMKRRILQLGVIIALLALLTTALHAADQSKTGFEVGNTAPEITGGDLEGKPMKLSEFRGKVVVLDFWGFW
jgi:hypothetical protein